MAEASNTTYNEQALRVLDLAKEEAIGLNHNYIGTEHLLLGLLREGSAATELINLGVTLEGIRGGILFIIGRGDVPPSSQLGFTPRTQEVLALAGAEAQRLKETAISPHHLLVGLLREGEGIGAKMLQVSGVRVEWADNTVHFSRVQEVEEGPVTVPTDLQLALEQHPGARSIFELLSSAKKKRLLDSLEQPLVGTTRSQRIEKVVEMLQKVYQQQQS